MQIYFVALNNVPGLDGITSIMLHNTASTISLPLSLIFNSSISYGTFPTDWKNSFVVPIPKSKSPSSSPSDYRPISFLSLVSKILERHIFNYLDNFCSYHNLLSNNQFCFRPGFSTETPLLSNVNSWLSSLDSNKPVCAVFFDLTKAFDSVPHRPLLDSLSSLNIPPILVSWFHSYLQGRTQQVVIVGSHSSKSHVIFGVYTSRLNSRSTLIYYIYQ